VTPFSDWRLRIGQRAENSPGDGAAGRAGLRPTSEKSGSRSGRSKLVVGRFCARWPRRGSVLTVNVPHQRW